MTNIQKRNLLLQLAVFSCLLVVNTTQATISSAVANSEQDKSPRVF